MIVQVIVMNVRIKAHARNVPKIITFKEINAKKHVMKVIMQMEKYVKNVNLIIVRNAHQQTVLNAVMNGIFTMIPSHQ